MNKLNGIPSINCISIEESLDRRLHIQKQFYDYNIQNINFLITKRYPETNDKVIGRWAHTLNNGTTGCACNHLKIIKKWLETTNEPYGFFCEDDLSLKTVSHWSFTFEEFVNTLPKDWDAIQLLTIRKDYENFQIRERLWDDWSVTAYIIKREYAKKIIDLFYLDDDTFKLELPDSSIDIQPLIENIIFLSGKTYTVPLFVEETDFRSTYTNKHDKDIDIETGQKSNHVHAKNTVLDLWSKKQFNIKDIFPNVAAKRDCNLKYSNENILEIEKLLTNYSLDTENGENNFWLGYWYWKQNHTAPALSYFLRCAERAQDKNLQYEALIWSYYCYEVQKTRDGTARTLLMHALCVMPERPEAYYLLSRFCERREQWQDAYYYAERGLAVCDTNFDPLKTDVDYPGKYGLLFEKAVSGYWWGKNDECKNILLDLKNNYDLNNTHKKAVYENLQRIGIKVDLPTNNSIPVIGVPIVNGVYWLQRLIQSIDYPVENLFIINNNGRNQITKELDEIVKKEYTFIKKISVVHLPANLGVPGSWNLVIKMFMHAPYWIISNHDIAFSPGLLEGLAKRAEEQTNVGLILGTEKQWDIFLIKDWAVQKCGLFDENLYPAYVEDWDYLFRVEKAKVEYEFVEAPYLHGEKNYKETGSQTWRVEKDLQEKLSYSRDVNELEYMFKKWGPQWLKDWHKDYSLCPWENPFNNPTYPITITSYDLNFVRKKHLGF